MIPMTETPIYRLPRFTAPFSVPPICAVNRGFTVQGRMHIGYNIRDDIVKGTT